VRARSHRRHAVVGRRCGVEERKCGGGEVGFKAGNDCGASDDLHQACKQSIWTKRVPSNDDSLIFQLNFRRCCSLHFSPCNSNYPPMVSKIVNVQPPLQSSAGRPRLVPPLLVLALLRRRPSSP
jgi:hypothetical protein